MTNSTEWLKESSSSCVVVGTFNIYIFQAEWLAQVLGLPAGSDVNIETDLSRPGFKLSSDKFDCNWYIRPDRLLLGSKTSSMDIGEPAKRVLKRLPETPLYAIGKNFTFQVEGPLQLKPSIPAMVNLPSITDGQVTKAGITVSVSIGHQSYNLGLTRHHNNGTEIAVNIHTDTEGFEHSQVIDELDRFVADRETAKRLVLDIWNQG